MMRSQFFRLEPVRNGCAFLTMALMIAMVDRAVAQTTTQAYSTQAWQIGTYETDASPGVQGQASFLPSLPQSARQRRASSRRSSLLFAGNLMGGYDDNAGATLGSGAVSVVDTSGYTTFADATLAYTRGTAARRIDVLGAGSLQMFPDYLDAPAAGGEARVSGHTKLSAANMLRFSTQVQYLPLFTPNLIEEVAEAPTVVEGAEALFAPIGFSSALIERRSLTTGNQIYLDRDWSRRDKTVASYSHVGQEIVEGVEGSNSYHRASAEYRRSLTRATALLGSYQYTDGRQTDSVGVTRPNRQHTIMAGSALTKALSRGRRFSFDGKAGAAYVENVTTTQLPVEGWMPTASASMAVGVTRQFDLRAGYSRGFSMLQGLTGEFYSTDRATLSLGGHLSPRAEFVVGGTYMNGRVAFGSKGGDTFDLYSGDISLRVALTSTLAATAGYFHYHQQYSNPAALPAGFPPRYDRDAFQIGLSLAVPLVGTQPARPRGSSPR